MKETDPGLRTVWFHLHGVLEKAKLQRRKNWRMVFRGWGEGQKLTAENTGEFEGMTELFGIFTEVVVTWLHMFVKTHRTICSTCLEIFLFYIRVCTCMLSCFRSVRLFVTLWTIAHEASAGKTIGMGCHAFLQGIVPTWGSNPCLLHLLHW